MTYISVNRVTKSFGTFKALDNVNIEVRKGAIHAILGENGAGKSTLMNILYGLYQPDEGEIRINGRLVSLKSPSDAIASGIGMIHQHFMLVESLTVLENVVMGLVRGPRPIDFAFHENRIRKMSAAFGFDLDPTAPIWTLPMGLRQRVEIIKALYRNAEILILDEPTSVLAPGEISSFIDGIRKLRDVGHTILFITHKLEEVIQVADSVTVMRHGKVVHETVATSTNSKELARWMVGRDVVFELKDRERSHEDVTIEAADILVVDGLTAVNDRGIQALDDVSFTVRAGEILGVSGVDGNGQIELAEAIAGLRPTLAGRIVLDGRDVASLGVKARIVEARIAFVPEDRQSQGLVLDYPVALNMVLRSFDRPPTSQYSVLNFAAIRKFASDLARRYDVRLRTVDQLTRFLSGGNQQKIILAREIEAAPRLLVVMQACKGLDVGAIEFVQKTILSLKENGVAVLYISTELEHVLDVSDRIAVMFRGRITGLLNRNEASTQRIGELMAGIDSDLAA